MRKFEDPNGGDVNYVAFVQAVDEEYTGQVMEQEKERWVAGATCKILDHLKL